MEAIDLFGNKRTIPDVEKPSEAWVEGWDWCMEHGFSSNPYMPQTQEYRDWNDGYEAAEEN